MACKSYVTASEDLKRGNGKKKELFFAQIMREYRRICQEKIKNKTDLSYIARTGDEILRTYKKARTECLNFE